MVNGEITKNENIADNGGIKVAYSAYKSWRARNFENSLDTSEEPRLPRFEKYSNNQMFWIYFTNVHCERYNDTLTNDFFDDVHAPNEFRVIGSLTNNPDFSADFNCPSGSRMNPPKKCTVW